MVEASGVTIAVRGDDARLFQERTGATTVLPFESSGELASTLRELVALGKDGQAGSTSSRKSCTRIEGGSVSVNRTCACGHCTGLRGP